MDQDVSPASEFHASAAGKLSSRRWALWLFLGLALAGVGAAAWLWRPRTAPPAPLAELDDQDLDEPARTNPGYVGITACAPCHAERVAAFQQTHHYRACREPRLGDMPHGFEPGQGRIATRDPALRFEMAREGSEFLETAIHTTLAGEERTTSRIGLVYGAGAADEVFHTWRPEGLFQLPVVWLHPQDCWGYISYSRYGTGDMARPTTTRCLECHNTWFDHVPGTASQYRREGAVIGITCERCHGPGREHVAYHQAHPGKETAHAIVHPGHLDRERQLEVCIQCHSNVTRPRGPAFDYVPGEVLETRYRTAHTRHPEEDHVANQIKYLRTSRCFQKSDMTCITCHDPHHKPNREEVEKSCLKCHQSKDCREQPRLPTAVRANCTGCHMPQRVWMNVNFHSEADQYIPPATRHEHRIAVDLTARDDVLLHWYRTQSDAASRREADQLTKSLSQHWLEVVEGYRREYRSLAAIGAAREIVRLDASAASWNRLRDLEALQAKLESELMDAQHQMEQRQYDEAFATLNRILALKPDQAWAHGRLGMIYANRGKMEQAVEQFQQVGQCDPDDPYGHTMLGWMAYSHDRPDEALKYYARAEECDPYNAKIAHFQGLAFAKLGRWADAGARFQRVLKIDPNQPEACQALSRALKEQGDPAKALAYARRAVHLSHGKNAELLLALADAYADTNRWVEARDTAAQALEVVPHDATDLLRQIQTRVEDYRARAASPGR